MREPGALARRAAAFGTALAAAAGLISLVPRPRHAVPGAPRPGDDEPPRGHLSPVLDPADPGPHGPAERHLPTARYEQKDVTFGALMLGGLGVLFCIACAAGVSWWVYPGADKTLHFKVPPTAYPSPTLQDDPVADMNRFRSEQLRQLNGIYWLDKAHGTVHLPIEDAMRIVARDGIPDWPKTPYPPAVPTR